METIRIKYFSDQIEKLTYIEKQIGLDRSAGRRRRCSEKGRERPHSSGRRMELPAGYEAHVVPRSSTFKNFGLIQTNHMGVIDESYCGDNDQWYMPVLAVRDTEIHINDASASFGS